jgi:hypothetical protein
MCPIALGKEPLPIRQAASSMQINRLYAFSKDQANGSASS